MVSLAGRKLQAAEPNLLGHVNRPDARPTAYVEDAGLQVWLYRRLVQLVPPCYCEELVVDIHAVLFWLVSRQRGLVVAGWVGELWRLPTSSHGYM